MLHFLLSYVYFTCEMRVINSVLYFLNLALFCIEFLASNPVPIFHIQILLLFLIFISTPFTFHIFTCGKINLNYLLLNSY